MFKTIAQKIRKVAVTKTPIHVYCNKKEGESRFDNAAEKEQIFQQHTVSCDTITQEKVVRLCPLQNLRDAPVIYYVNAGETYPLVSSRVEDLEKICVHKYVVGRVYLSLMICWVILCYNLLFADDKHRTTKN